MASWPRVTPMTTFPRSRAPSEVGPVSTTEQRSRGRHRWALVAALSVLVLVGACGPEQRGTASPSPTSLNSGVRGTVLLGPTCPVEQPDASPCLAPYAAKLVITDSQGAVVAEVTSGSDGRFQIALAPGDYVIQPTPGNGGLPSALPQGVTVAPDQFIDVEIDYDTGIR
jgi:hypothetical protein